MLEYLSEVQISNRISCLDQNSKQTEEADE